MNVLSSLQVMEAERICLHEEHEPARLDDTCSALCQDGVLRHPPLAMRMKDGRYLILDGAHRTAALRQMGCRWIPVQVVDPADFRLEAWDHLVPMGTWLYGLLHDAHLRWEAERRHKQLVAEVMYPSGKRLYLYAREKSHDRSEKLHAWHRIVSAYSRKYAVQRVARGSVSLPEEGTVCLRYPVCTIEEIEKIVASGQVMPAGVTRFLVSGRLLNLRIPLFLLTGSTFNHQEWEHYRKQWEGALRLYAEAVYLCEKEVVAAQTPAE
jgi:L-serine kinase (ATP) / ParB family transcriptional regulator, heme-responsive regulator